MKLPSRSSQPSSERNHDDEEDEVRDKNEDRHARKSMLKAPRAPLLLSIRECEQLGNLRVVDVAEHLAQHLVVVTQNDGCRNGRDLESLSRILHRFVRFVQVDRANVDLAFVRLSQLAEPRKVLLARRAGFALVENENGICHLLKIAHHVCLVKRIDRAPRAV
jgi:hypothetical protein